MSEEKSVSRQGKTEAKATEKAKTVSKAKTSTKSKTESPVQSKTRAKAVAKPKAEAKVTAVKDEAKAAPQAALKKETKTATAKKTAVKSTSAIKTKAETKSKTASKTKAESGVKGSAKPKTVLKPKAESGKAQAAAKPKTAAKPKAGPRTKASGPKDSFKPTGAELAELVAAAAAEHKPIDPVLLDLSGRSSVADWFFVASADNPRQMEAIAEKIIRRARERGVRPLGHEGLGRGGTCPWVLVDLGDVVVHIFNLEARGLYDLEGLWTDAPRHPLKS